MQPCFLLLLATYVPSPIFCCTYCWFICAGAAAAWNMFSFHLFHSIYLWNNRVFCIMYQCVCVCEWMVWRNHGMLYNDATFQSCINLIEIHWELVYLPFLFLLFFKFKCSFFLPIAFECSAYVMSDQNKRGETNLRFFFNYLIENECPRSLYFALFYPTQSSLLFIVLIFFIPSWQTQHLNCT